MRREHVRPKSSSCFFDYISHWLLSLLDGWIRCSSSKSILCFHLRLEYEEPEDQTARLWHSKCKQKYNELAISLIILLMLALGRLNSSSSFPPGGAQRSSSSWSSARDIFNEFDMNTEVFEIYEIMTISIYSCYILKRLLVHCSEICHIYLWKTNYTFLNDSS